VAESSGFSPKAAALLRDQGDVVLADVDRSDLLSVVGEADVLWVRLRHRIDAEVMAAAPRLQVIVTSTTGLNHIDLEETRRLGIHVLSLRSENEFLAGVRATAEYTIALILSLLRHVPVALAHVKSGGWNRDQFKGSEVFGKTVGVVGYGRLGRIVARYFRGFDTRVLTSDPNVDAASVAPDALVPLSQLLQEADVVTLHVNLCAETYGFFGHDQFAAMKQGAWFINTARGELVDESALLGALRSGQLGGAALDVLCEEQSAKMEKNPLVVYARDHDNLIITPHIGGCTAESMEKTELFLAERLASDIRLAATGSNANDLFTF
jgi:D-3-phosphoglycerate dehydrogenase